MKILQIHNEYQIFGGESNVIENEKSLLISKGHDLEQFIVKNSLLNEYTTLEKVKFFKETVSSHKFENDLSKKISEFTPDVVHVHNVFPLLSPSIYLFIKNLNIPIVQTVHNFRFMCPNGLFYTKDSLCEKCSNGNFLHAALNKCYKDSYSLSSIYAYTIHYHNKKNTFRDNIDHFLLLSQFALNKFEEFGYDKNKLSIKPNFLNYENTSTSSDFNYKYFLFIGRLDKIKGIYDYLEIARNMKEYTFKILGSGDEDNNVKKIISEEGLSNIELLGYKAGEEKNTIIKNALAVIVPSICYEMFPMVILEAFKYKKAVISNDIGSKKEFIKNNHSGLIYKSRNIKNLVNQMKNLSNEDYKVMGLNAYNVFKNNYTEKINYDYLMNVYNSVISKKKNEIDKH